MARPLRVVFSGAWYHVMNRGAAKAPVFVTEADASTFLALLGELERRFGVEVHGYCLMENHYHVLLRTPDANLSRAMRHLDGVFTQRAHRRRGTDGPIFRGRFKSVLVQADGHLLTASRYIHLNPTEAGLVSRPEDWAWSSHRAYLEPSRGPRWLRTETILGLLGPPDARERYRALVDAGLDSEGASFYARPKWQPILGDQAFVDRARQELARLGEHARREMPQSRSSQLRVPLARIAAEVSVAFGIAPDALGVGRGRTTPPVIASARGALVQVAQRLGGWTLVEIAASIGYRSRSGPWRVACRFDEAASTDPDLHRRLEAILRSFGIDGRPPDATPADTPDSGVEEHP